MRKLGIILIILGVFAALGQWLGVAIPTARWFFDVSRELDFLHTKAGKEVGFLWFGWLSVVLLCGLGGWLWKLGGVANPIAQRRWQRFRAIRRGYLSFWFLLGLMALAGADQLLVGKRALAVQYKGTWIFPALMVRDIEGRELGVRGEKSDLSVDFLALQQKWKTSGEGKIWMPLVPYDPTGDSLPSQSRALEKNAAGLWLSADGVPYNGLLSKLYDVSTASMHVRFRVRNGVLDGPADGWDRAGNLVYTADYGAGQVRKERYVGEGTQEKFLAQASSEFREVFYHPAPPMPREGHWLGTTTQGYDVVAYLFGGLQVNFKAAMIYLVIVYTAGIVFGLLGGFFGGWFDLITQRLVEILTNVPFLFVVIIFSSWVDEKWKGLPVILTILMAFGWLGIASLMRTAAFREKQRDYVASARVMGAGTWRIVFHHLMPNTISVVLTLLPFTFSGLVFSLTSLDYLGFGLPPSYATWGRLLNDGLANLSAPWLVSSTFTILVLLLVLITFVGEAIREAFDPKKFTFYR